MHKESTFLNQKQYFHIRPRGSRAQGDDLASEEKQTNLLIPKSIRRKRDDGIFYHYIHNIYN